MDVLNGMTGLSTMINDRVGIDILPSGSIRICLFVFVPQILSIFQALTVVLVKHELLWYAFHRRKRTGQNGIGKNSPEIG